MSAFFGQDLLAQIRAANDIVEVIQWLHVPLKKAGAHYRALCPFHKEKTPSFNVNAQRQSFHCFGCGVGGDVFKFLMLREGLDFPSAVTRLAERAHIPIPEKGEGLAGPSRSEREKLYDLHVRVRNWYHAQLMRSRQAKSARDYLKERGFDSNTAKTHHLGYAPPGWDGLLQWALSEKLSSEFLEQAGLVVSGRRGLYDRFRDRLMIPISDESGRVVGFSGRLLSSEAKEAKYVNSPETPIFRKGRLLFGLDRSKRDILAQKSAILCEGQLDWIRCYESGILNVVAPQGTAFTEDQARILKRYAEQVILCFDSDTAGQKATWKNAETLISVGIVVRAAHMPEGEDPDSLIRKKGKEALQKILDQAADVFEYKALAMLKSLNMRDPRNHARVVTEMTPLLALVDNEPQLQRIIHNVADILRIDVPAFLAEFQRQKRRQIRIASREAILGRDSISPSRDSSSSAPGDYLLRLALTDESASRMIFACLKHEWLNDYSLRHILFHILRRSGEGRWKSGWEGIDDLELNDFDRECIGRLLTHPMPLHRKTIATGLEEALMSVQRAHLKALGDDLSRQLQDSTLSESEQIRLQTELLDLARRIKHL